MLVEIFQEIGQQLLVYVQEHSHLGSRVRYRIGERGRPKSHSLRMDLLGFGFDSQHNNYLPNSPIGKTFYSFTFFVTAETAEYEHRLELIEHACDHFDKRPFIQVRLREREYEVAISPLQVSMEALNDFWIARQSPHQPVLFYQARISEV